MARRRQYAPLRVYLNNRLVGHLLKEPGGAIDFQYDESWLAWKHETVKENRCFPPTFCA